MFKRSNFCHVASNNRNNVKAGLFVYRTTDALNTVTASGYFNEMIIDLKLHDLIIHEQYDPADNTKVTRNLLCVIERTTDNVIAEPIVGDWEEEMQEYIEETFVKKDGSSVMSAPLKLAAGSFRGALGPGLNGLIFLKMDSSGNLTQIASLSDTQFVPSTNDTMSIGSSAKKIKTVYATRLNNGYDINIPVTTEADTVALKSQVDDAANSGEQLYTTGVWYAKMYAATVVPTGAEYDGRNYADFSQVDNDNNPIIVIYTGASGAWTETTRITPPANHNGYITVTSKIWDIAEQAGQQGGQILWSWNNKTFTPYPRIVSFDGIHVTGESVVNMPVDSVGGQIVNKDYVDYKTSQSLAQSNCITVIPQDIKLELNSGVLTLKAGSKIRVPNGVGVFDEVTTTTDLTYSSGWSNTQFFVYLYQNTLVIREVNITESGAASSLTSQYRSWYDSTNNLVKWTDDSGSTWVSGYSFPLAIISTDASSIISIDQIFNGWGYIGQHAFMFPGVKGLIPNGRNDDGTAKNITITTDSIYVVSIVGMVSKISYLSSSGQLIGWGEGAYYQQDTEPSSPVVNAHWYDTRSNYMKRYNTDHWEAIDILYVGGLVKTGTNTSISSFKPRSVFRALDVKDLAFAKSEIQSNSLSVTGSDAINSILTTTGISKGTDGYVKLGNGLIIQWLTVSHTVQNQFHSLPTAFSSGTSYIAVASWAGDTESAYPITIASQTSTQVSINSYTGLVNRNVNIIAIGY